MMRSLVVVTTVIGILVQALIVSAFLSLPSITDTIKTPWRSCTGRQQHLWPATCKGSRIVDNIQPYLLKRKTRSENHGPPSSSILFENVDTKNDELQTRILENQQQQQQEEEEEEKDLTENNQGISSSSPSSAASFRLLSNKEALDALYPHFPRTWVPLASTAELDPNRPTPVEFLGRSYVTYRTALGSDNSSSSDVRWVVMDNTCPHRLAPLSEGRIEPETRRLQCSYHGWTFNPYDGSCENIPQASSSVQQAAIQNPRSCLVTYTAYVDPDTSILWIWPWKEDVMSFVTGREDNDDNFWRHPEGIMKNVIPGGNTSIVTTYTRDLPYGWDTLVENLIDPAHIPFAHHGLQGTREDAIPINMTKATNYGQEGFSFEWADRTMGSKRNGTGEFRAPYFVNYNAVFEPKPGTEEKKESSPRPFRLSVLCVPTTPGWSRVIFFSVAPAADAPSAVTDKQGQDVTTTTLEEDSGGKHDESISKKSKGNRKKFSLVSSVFKILPGWMVHSLNNRFFDSDLAFLHYQEKLRRPQLSPGSAGTLKTTTITEVRGDSRYFMPAECDRSIAALHKWIGQYAMSYIEQQACQLPPAIYDRNQLFDRWTQHTSHCKVCQDGLTRVKKLKRYSQIVLASSILLSFRHWAPRIMAVSSLGMLKLLGKIEESFYKGEFKHYENL